MGGKTVATSSLSTEQQFALYEMLTSMRFPPISTAIPTTKDRPGSPTDDYYAPGKTPSPDDPRVLSLMTPEQARLSVRSIQKKRSIQ